MLPRRWYGAALLAAALLIGSVYAQRPDAPLPATVSLEVVGPPTIPIGQPFTYEIGVRNTGKVAAAKVRVEDELSGGARLLQSEPPADVQKESLAWSLGTLEAGSERRVKVTVQVDDLGDAKFQPMVSFAPAAGLQTPAARAALVVALAAPETAQVGQSVRFEIRVTNKTAEPLEQVVLRARIPPGLQFLQGDLVEADIGTLAVNESRTVRLEARAEQPGRAVTEVTAKAAGGLTARGDAAVLVQEPSLAIRLDAVRRATMGDEMSLRVEVANPTAKAVSGVGLLLTLPDGIEPLSASTGGTLDPTNRHVVGWKPGALAVGDRQSLAVKAKANVAGDWTCQASARGEGLAEATATASVHVEAAPALGLTVLGRDVAIDCGAEAVYEMRVLNQAAAPSRGVRLVAQVPEGLQVVHAEGPTVAVIQAHQVQFDPVAELAGRTEAVFKLRVRGAAAGAWRLRVRVDAEVPQQPVLQEVNLRVLDAARDGLRPAGAPANHGAPR